MHSYTRSPNTRRSRKTGLGPVMHPFVLTAKNDLILTLRQTLRYRNRKDAMTAELNRPQQKEQEIPPR